MKRQLSAAPEIASYTKYYEQDGMLRAYANRSMLLAMIFGLLATAALGFAIYVRIQPAMVIRVNSDGTAVVIAGPHAAEEQGARLTVDGASSNPGSSAAPTDIEGRAVVRQFLNRYLAYTPDSADRNLADALNMMTTNLREYSLNKLRDDDTVGKIRADHVISEFEIRSIEPVKGAPWTYTVFGVKEIHHVKSQSEVTDQIVGRYNIRLVETSRSESDPSGLLVAEYGEEQMVGDQENGLLQKSELEGDAH